ncbi:glyoxalase/bleomycin resistance protein/dioxygenase, partial [Nitritalea halalkaliphila LW7]
TVKASNPNPRKNERAFSPLLCKTTLELIERTDKKGIPLFRDRDWGDQGFIHLCFDINGMQALKARCAKFGHPFTVDSSDSFDMGKAAGHFAYCEDPDGTLIEFVETHKIPIFEKIGWYLNLQKRDPEKPLPRWLLHLLGLNKVKG